MNKERGYNFEQTVRLMFKGGMDVHKIAKTKNVKPDVVTKILVDYRLLIRIVPRSSGILGGKTEPYYKNEDDLLAKPQYKYEDLSSKERRFYESRQSKSEILQKKLG